MVVKFSDESYSSHFGGYVFVMHAPEMEMKHTVNDLEVIDDFIFCMSKKSGSTVDNL